MSFHGPRHKENQLINTTRQTYIDGRPSLNNVDRKLMLKMYDRERDYNWIFDASTQAASLDTATTRNTIGPTSISSLIESSDENRKARLGQTATSWNGYGARRSFPQLVKLEIGEQPSNEDSSGDRLYESMTDHALSDGPLTFPIMGWPYYVRNNGIIHSLNDYKVNNTTYPVTSEIPNISFVGLNYPTMAEFANKFREKRANTIGLLDSAGSYTFDNT